MNNTEKAVLKRQIGRANSLSTELLACRVGGDRHHWVQCQPDFVVQAGVPMVHQCAACDTIKRAIVAPLSGELLSRNYEYPAEYQLKRTEGIDHDERLISSASVRVALIGRNRHLAPLRKAE